MLINFVKKYNKQLIVLIILLLILILTNFSFAADSDIVSIINGIDLLPNEARASTQPGILESIVGTVSTNLSSKLDLFQSAAERLFLILAAIAVVWTGVELIVSKGDLSDFFAQFLKLIVVLGFFWYLCTGGGTELALKFLDSMLQLGSQASGQNKLTSSGLLGLMNDLFEKIKWPWFSPGLSFATFLTYILIYLCAVVIAINVLLIHITAIICIYAGVIVLGFGALGWTREIVIAYFKQVANICLQLLTVLIIFSIASTEIQNIVSTSGGPTRSLFSLYLKTGGISLPSLISILGFMALCAFLSAKIPPLVGGLIGGAGVGSMQFSLSQAAAAVATTAAAIASVGAGAAALGAGAAAARGAGATAKGGSAAAKGAGAAAKGGGSNSAANLASATNGISGGGGSSGGAKGGSAFGDKPSGSSTSESSSSSKSNKSNGSSSAGGNNNSSAAKGSSGNNKGSSAAKGTSGDNKDNSAAKSSSGGNKDSSAAKDSNDDDKSSKDNSDSKGSTGGNKDSSNFSNSNSNNSSLAKSLGKFAFDTSKTGSKLAKNYIEIMEGSTSTANYQNNDSNNTQTEGNSGVENSAIDPNNEESSFNLDGGSDNESKN